MFDWQAHAGSSTLDLTYKTSLTRKAKQDRVKRVLGLTRIPRIKNKLQIPISSIYSVARFLVIGIDMRKPAYTTVWSGFEIWTFGVEEIKISLRWKNIHFVPSSVQKEKPTTYFFVRNISYCWRAIWFHTGIGHRWPTILVERSLITNGFVETKVNLPDSDRAFCFDRCYRTSWDLSVRLARIRFLQ